ncbi:MAG TPA: molybdopterin-dependent oxidoreductase, partial [Burkholderiaceae bacterium]|nr:molybdopterin-dependent oxidoreductase [Burkholderiaceae bacterium]
MKFGGAQPAPARVEDRALLTGQGRYTDDLQIEGQAHAAFARAQLAHARILSIDTSAAEAMPGVLGVFTGARLRDAGLGAIETFVRMPGRNGEPMFAPGIPVLAMERVRYVGEPVVMVVAETALQALDAAEAVFVEYDELPAAASIERALAPEAPVLWDGAPGNLALDWGHGDAGLVEAAMARAAHIVRVRLLDPPVAPTALEPRAAIASWEDERYTLIAPTQGVSVV